MEPFTKNHRSGLLLVVLMLNCALFGDVRVKLSGNLTTDAEGSKTKVNFFMEEGYEDAPVLQMVRQAVSYSGTSTAVAQAFDNICITPCELELTPGFYTFKIGSVPINITAKGGEKAYKIKPWKRSGGLGLIGMAAGIGFLAGSLPFIFMDDLKGMAMGGMIAGGALFSVSLPFYLKGKGRATEISAR